MTDKKQIKSIIQQYAEKGEKLYNESCETKEDSQTIGYWDGYRDCANLLLRELEDMQEETMPAWKRATEDILIGCLVWDETRNFHLYSDRVYKGELYISMADILRLPNSPRKE